MLKWIYLFVKGICTVICVKLILCVNYNCVCRPGATTVSKEWSDKNYDTSLILFK